MQDSGKWQTCNVYTPHSQRAQLAVFHRQQHTGEEQGAGSSVLACQRPVLTPRCPGGKAGICVGLCGAPKGRAGAPLSPPRGPRPPLAPPQRGPPEAKARPQNGGRSFPPSPPKMAAGGLARRAGAGASRGAGRGRSRQVRGAAGPGPRGEPPGRPPGAVRASRGALGPTGGVRWRDPGWRAVPTDVVCLALCKIV